MLIISTWR